MTEIRWYDDRTQDDAPVQYSAEEASAWASGWAAAVAEFERAYLAGERLISDAMIEKVPQSNAADLIAALHQADDFYGQLDE